MVNRAERAYGARTLGQGEVSTMGYQEWIAAALLRRGVVGLNPRHVEAYLRLKFGTLDALSDADLERELDEIIPTVRADRNAAEALAQSLGL
jgi:hypothetical protein